MSKKLSGNGLWESSRMMLPEHREVLVERRKPTASTENSRDCKTLSAEERMRIRQSVILSVACSVAKGNLQRLQNLHSPLHKLYVQATLVLISSLQCDEIKAKQELSAKGICIEQSSDADELHCRWSYQGTVEGFVYTRDVLRQEVARELKHYIAALFSSKSAH